MKKKKLLVMVLAMACIATISITATLAYFTDTDSVTNTFSVGQLGILLDEAKVNEYGEEVDGADRVQTNDYKVIPGHTYVKDPTVTLDADSEEAYIRMIVTVNNMSVFEAACPNDFANFGGGNAFLIEKYVTGWDASKWECVSAVRTDDMCTYEFRYTTTVNTVDAEAKALEPLFTKITMPGALTNAQVIDLEDLEINIVAHAMQANGFATADLAWASFTLPTNP